MTDLKKIESDLQKLVPDMCPYITRRRDGLLKISFRWALEIPVPSEDHRNVALCLKAELLDHFYAHLGKLTVRIRKLEEDIQKDVKS